LASNLDCGYWEFRLRSGKSVTGSPRRLRINFSFVIGNLRGAQVISNGGRRIACGLALFRGSAIGWSTANTGKDQWLSPMLQSFLPRTMEARSVHASERVGKAPAVGFFFLAATDIRRVEFHQTVVTVISI